MLKHSFITPSLPKAELDRPVQGHALSEDIQGPNVTNQAFLVASAGIGSPFKGQSPLMISWVEFSCAFSWIF